MFLLHVHFSLTYHNVHWLKLRLRCKQELSAHPKLSDLVRRLGFDSETEKLDGDISKYILHCHWKQQQCMTHK